MIAGEARRDVTAVSKELRMDASGRLVLPGGARLPMTERAFTSLVAAHHSGIGGGAYLARCWPKLRALNVNHWLTKIGADELAVRNALPAAEVDAWQPSSLTLRTRKGAKPGVTEVFGVVSPSYTAFDVDKIARAIAIAMPKEARAEITYDGQRASFDIRFHSKVKPEHYVAGEFFRAGIRVRTDDTGGGAIQVSSTIWQNLCLNLIIIDEQTQGLARIRHVGSVDELAKRLATALKDAKGTLAHFLKAWDYAVTDTIDATTVDAEPGVEVPSRIEDLLPGIFLGLAQRELVPIRRPKEAIPQLMKMWGEDTSAAAGATRGAVVNAITRYAHTVNEDPWHEDELERAAGRILYGTRGTPAPLPYVPVEA